MTAVFDETGEPMAQRGLIGAVLYAKDLPRLAEFYAAVAGLPVSSLQAEFAILGREPSRFVIVRIPRPIADAIEITAPPALREDTPVKLVFAVEDIATARMRAAERGGALKAADREWEFEGVKVCDGWDPEGNIFQVRNTT